VSPAVADLLKIGFLVTNSPLPFIKAAAPWDSPAGVVIPTPEGNSLLYPLR